MSVLELSGRPFVVFDPANTDHREFYYEFFKKSTWGKCPYRFVVPEDHGNLVTMIQRSLVNGPCVRDWTHCGCPLFRQVICSGL